MEALPVKKVVDQSLVQTVLPCSLQELFPYGLEIASRHRNLLSQHFCGYLIFLHEVSELSFGISKRFPFKEVITSCKLDLICGLF